LPGAAKASRGKGAKDGRHLAAAILEPPEALLSADWQCHPLVTRLLRAVWIELVSPLWLQRVTSTVLQKMHSPGGGGTALGQLVGILAGHCN